jgi:precorrin-2 dehydrogenase/sirohydrochlorin ferrochelatase
MVGAGKVALRRIQAILDTGALISVVAGESLPQFTDWEKQGKLSLYHREYQPADLANKRIVFACTNHPNLNQEIVNQAKQQGCWAEGCTAQSEGNLLPGAVIRQGLLSIAISSSGELPLLSKTIRECLERIVDPGWEAFTVDLLMQKKTLSSEQLTQLIRDRFQQALRACRNLSSAEGEDGLT